MFPTPQAKNWAIFCHVSALLGLGTGIGFVLGPLIIWLLKREEHPFINDQGREAVNFQLTMALATLVSGILVVALIGVPLLIIVGLLATIFPIIAALKVLTGERYRYPLTIRFLKGSD